MRRRIGIVGAGIAGLHRLYLQKHGVEATLITDRAPDRIAASACSTRSRTIM